MSVSTSVREALTKARKRQMDLCTLWDTSPQVISNKFRLERWTGEELARVAAYTGGKLAFVYPDGQQIFINASVESEDANQSTVKARQEKPATTSRKEKIPLTTKKKMQAKAKTKKGKEPELKEEQISFFG